MRCQRQILDVCWWTHVSNAEVLQRSGLSTIVDILRHRRLSLFGLVERLDPGVPAHDALRLTVDTPTEAERLEKTTPGTGSPSQRLAQQGSRLYCSYLRCGDLRSPGATERRNGSFGLRDDDHDDEG